jgi:glyoxylase-like metal-dependent hydrolase (beta-lactamase superfamily II)
MASSLRVVALFALFALFALSAATRTSSAQPAPTYDVYAIRYATLAQFPVRGLIAGADTSRRMDIAMTVWLLRGNGRVVLVDAGFYRDKFVQRWKPVDFVLPSEAVARAGVKPEDVTDIIVSHIHWDHADGVDLFPNARVWIQKEEYVHHIGAMGGQLDRAIDPDDAKMFATLASRGRIHQVDGDSVQIMPGITVFTGGKHTFASQYVSVETAAGTVVLASDNAYLYENFEKHVPIAQTLDAASNLRAQERMLTIASSPRLIVPGHDPLVFQRFPSQNDRVVRIR